MRVGVLSDTHDRLPTLEAALATFQAMGIDTIFHAGDIVAPFAAKQLAAFPGVVHVVYGNNDGERDGLKAILPQIQDGPLFVEIAGKKILLHHFIDWCHDEHLASADIIITGHTHQVAVSRRHGKLVINPGECCGWVTGNCTAVVLDVETNDTEIIEIPT